MPGPFDLVQVDPMQAQQEWRQTLATTAMQEARAQQEQLVVQETKQKIQAQAAAQEQQKKYQQALAQAQQKQTQQSSQIVSEGPDFMGQIESRMNIALSYGQLGDAEKLSKMANETKEKQAQALEHVQAAADKKAQAAVKRTELGEGLLTSVKDPQSYQQALEQYKSAAGEDDWYKYMKTQPYSPQLIDLAKSYLTKQRDAAAQEKDKAEALAVARNAASLEKLRRAQTAKDEYELQYAKTHDLAVNKAEGKPAVSKVGAVEALNTQQLIRAGQDVATGLNEILKLPVGAHMGTFSDVAFSHDPTFLGSAKKLMANKMTSDESQAYATRLAGVAVAAATIASGGRAARISQVEAESNALKELAGQSKQTALDKIHQASLKALRGIELSRPANDEQKEQLELVKSRLADIEQTTGSALENLKSGKAKKDAPQPNISKEEYSKLKPGDTFYFNGEKHTKD